MGLCQSYIIKDIYIVNKYDLMKYKFVFFYLKSSLNSTSKHIEVVIKYKSIIKGVTAKIKLNVDGPK